MYITKKSILFKPLLLFIFCTSLHAKTLARWGDVMTGQAGASSIASSQHSEHSLAKSPTYDATADVASSNISPIEHDNFQGSLEHVTDADTYFIHDHPQPYFTLSSLMQNESVQILGCLAGGALATAGYFAQPSLLAPSKFVRQAAHTYSQKPANDIPNCVNQLQSNYNTQIPVPSIIITPPAKQPDSFSVASVPTCKKAHKSACRAETSYATASLQAQARASASATNQATAHAAARLCLPADNTTPSPQKEHSADTPIAAAPPKNHASYWQKALGAIAGLGGLTAWKVWPYQAATSTNHSQVPVQLHEPWNTYRPQDLQYQAVAKGVCKASTQPSPSSPAMLPAPDAPSFRKVIAAASTLAGLVKLQPKLSCSSAIPMPSAPTGSALKFRWHNISDACLQGLCQLVKKGGSVPAGVYHNALALSSVVLNYAANTSAPTQVIPLEPASTNCTNCLQLYMANVTSTLEKVAGNFSAAEFTNSIDPSTGAYAGAALGALAVAGTTGYAYWRWQQAQKLSTASPVGSIMVHAQATKPAKAYTASWRLKDSVLLLQARLKNNLSEDQVEKVADHIQGLEHMLGKHPKGQPTEQHRQLNELKSQLGQHVAKLHQHKAKQKKADEQNRQLQLARQEQQAEERRQQKLHEQAMTKQAAQAKQNAALLKQQLTAQRLELEALTGQESLARQQVIQEQGSIMAELFQTQEQLQLQLQERERNSRLVEQCKQIKQHKEALQQTSILEKRSRANVAQEEQDLRYLLAQIRSTEITPTRPAALEAPKTPQRGSNQKHKPKTPSHQNADTVEPQKLLDFFEAEAQAEQCLQESLSELQNLEQVARQKMAQDILATLHNFTHDFKTDIAFKNQALALAELALAASSCTQGEEAEQAHRLFSLRKQLLDFIDSQLNQKRCCVHEESDARSSLFVEESDARIGIESHSRCFLGGIQARTAYNKRLRAASLEASHGTHTPAKPSADTEELPWSAELMAEVLEYIPEEGENLGNGYQEGEFSSVGSPHYASSASEFSLPSVRGAASSTASSRKSQRVVRRRGGHMARLLASRNS